MTTASIGPTKTDTARLVATAGVVGVAFVLCYGDVMALLVSQWWSNDVYSYGFLIPPISAYLVWLKRRAVMAKLGNPSWSLGVPVLVASLCTLIAGGAGAFATLQELSLLLVFVGGVLLVGGLRVVRILWLPLTYLVFALPIWDSFTAPLHAPFQLLSARIGEVLLGLFQVPAYRIGNVLQLPTVTLEVARECSGVNYLISIVAVAIPYSYLSVSSARRRVMVVMMSVVVAIVSNGLRVAFIGALQHYGLYSGADLHGPNHVLQGMFVAVVGYAALFLGAWFLEEPRSTGDRRLGDPDHPPAFGGSSRTVTAAVALAGLLLAASAVRWNTEAGPVALGRPDVIPIAIGPWVSSAGDAQRSAIRADHPDTEFVREYRADAFGAVQLYIGYFTHQRLGRKVVGSGGVSLLPGSQPLLLALPSGVSVDLAEAKVNLQDGSHQLVVAWYDLDGQVTAGDLSAKWLTIRNAVTRRRSNGAVVALTFDQSVGVDDAAARAALLTFARDILRTEGAFVSGGR